jgi:hypothetical protein
MSKLLVNPTLAGFGVGFGENVIRTKLDGGAGRYRLDKIGSTHEARVQWVLEAQGYDYLMAFYRTEIDYGSLPFTIDLRAADESNLGTYTARIVPGSLAMSGYLGNLYRVQATLELTPRTISGDQDAIDGGPE